MSDDSANYRPILCQAMSAVWIRILLLFLSLLDEFQELSPV